jgi:hypothetical protein
MCSDMKQRHVDEMMPALAIVLVKRLKNSKVVPKKDATTCPQLSSVLPESST